MSITLERLLTQAIDNYPITATLAPEVVAVMLYALSQIEDPIKWLDEREDPLDEITPTDADEIDILVSAANMSIISPEVGFIKPYITTSPPDNTIPCDGGTYAREDYPLLYAVLDSVFIVDADNFSVPNLQGLVLIGAGSVGLRTFTLGDNGGEYEHQLTTSELAYHSHSIPQIIGVPTQEGIGVNRNVTVPLLSDSTGSEGGDAAHNNIQPYGVVKYCVQAR